MTRTGGPDPRLDRDPPGWVVPVEAVYQPVVELDTGSLVGFEALARGPRDSALHSPAALFDAARRAGSLVELDIACRIAAFTGALQAPLPSRLALFVNVEPQALSARLPAYAAPVMEAAADLTVVLEITERALAVDPAGLLRAAEEARSRGWRIALDDVGADQASLALLPFLRPDVIKLDLRLVQAHTTTDTAEIITAVNAEAERTGAVVLAEGIETAEQADIALMMGARLGQGWLFGRPARLGPVTVPAADVAPLPRLCPAGPSGVARPVELVRESLQLRRATKPLLRAVSRQLERQALALGDAVVVFGTFQHARHFSPTVARRYATLAAASPLVAVFGSALPAEPAGAVRGVALDAHDPLMGDWDVAVVGPHFAVALIADDLGDGGPDAERRFDYCVTYDRPTVLAAAGLLMRRVPQAEPAGSPAPKDVGPAAASSPVDQLVPAYEGPPWRGRRFDGLESLLTAAVVNAAHGVSIADARHPEMPLIWVNRAFSDITGYSADAVLDHNCRLLQGARTDRDTVRALRRQLTLGRTVRTTLLNYRPDGTTWWNDLLLTPVHDEYGELSHYVGQQTDVSAQVAARRQADYLAYHDPLTGLANRAQLLDHLAAEVQRARRSGTSVALLYLDVDHFKAVNDTFGHTAGDRLLTVLAARLRSATRSGDLLARVGGDEFLLAVGGLRDDPVGTAYRRAAAVLAALAEPLALTSTRSDTSGTAGVVPVGASIGISVHPRDAATPEELVDHADQAMYAAKAAGRNQAVTFDSTTG